MTSACSPQDKAMEQIAQFCDACAESAGRHSMGERAGAFREAANFARNLAAAPDAADPESARLGYMLGFSAAKNAAADKVRALTLDFATHGSIDSANPFKEMELCIRALICPLSDAREAAEQTQAPSTAGSPDAEQIVSEALCRNNWSGFGAVCAGVCEDCTIPSQPHACEHALTVWGSDAQEILGALSKAQESSADERDGAVGPSSGRVASPPLYIHCAVNKALRVVLEQVRREYGAFQSLSGETLVQMDRALKSSPPAPEQSEDVK